MSSTRLLASLCRIHLLGCLVDEVLQLKSLNQVSVPNHAAVSDTNILVLLHHLIDNFLTLGQVYTVAVHRCVLLHVDLQITSQICSWDRTFAMPDLVHACNRGFASILR